MLETIIQIDLICFTAGKISWEATEQIHKNYTAASLWPCYLLAPNNWEQYKLNILWRNNTYLKIYNWLLGQGYSFIYKSHSVLIHWICWCLFLTQLYSYKYCLAVIFIKINMQKSEMEKEHFRIICWQTHISLFALFFWDISLGPIVWDNSFGICGLQCLLGS